MNNRCPHGNEIPDEILNSLNDSQARSGRHKCVTCAYASGLISNNQELLTSGFEVEKCEHSNSMAPKITLENLPDYQGRPGRHKCAICAYHEGLLASGINPLSSDNYEVELREAVRKDYESERSSAGESDAHKALKELIKNNPKIVCGYEEFSERNTEFQLLSGDKLDVMLRSNRSYVAVEVKSSISKPTDILRGLFQCVKYEAVMNVELQFFGASKEVRVYLVLQSSLPVELNEIRKKLEIRVVENIDPSNYPNSTTSA